MGACGGAWTMAAPLFSFWRERAWPGWVDMAGVGRKKMRPPTVKAEDAQACKPSVYCLYKVVMVLSLMAAHEWIHFENFIHGPSPFCVLVAFYIQFHPKA